MEKAQPRRCLGWAFSIYPNSLKAYSLLGFLLVVPFLVRQHVEVEGGDIFNIKIHVLG